MTALPLVTARHQWKRDWVTLIACFGPSGRALQTHGNAPGGPSTGGAKPQCCGGFNAGVYGTVLVQADKSPDSKPSENSAPTTPPGPCTGTTKLDGLPGLNKPRLAMTEPGATSAVNQ